MQIIGKWDDAGETYGEALRLSKKLSSKTLMGRANNSLGYLHLLLGNYRDAEYYFDKAIELFSLINDIQYHLFSDYKGMHVRVLSPCSIPPRPCAAG